MGAASSHSLRERTALWGNWAALALQHHQASQGLSPPLQPQNCPNFRILPLSLQDRQTAQMWRELPRRCRSLLCDHLCLRHLRLRHQFLRYPREAWGLCTTDWASGGGGRKVRAEETSQKLLLEDAARSPLPGSLAVKRRQHVFTCTALPGPVLCSMHYFIPTPNPDKTLMFYFH